VRYLEGVARVSRYAALGVGLLIALALPSAGASAYPGSNGRIAYESNQGGADSEIMNGAIDGSGSVQLTNNTVDDKDPAWSPDGKKIAFARLNAGTGRFEIWTMNADGSSQTAVVTNATRNLTYPTWKPGGAKIAFVQEFSSTDHDLYQADSTGLNSNVASIVLSAADERDPAWSPVNANKIMYARKTSGASFELRTITLSPFADTLVLSDAGHDLMQPAWSPDGAQVSFTWAGAADRDIQRVNADGSGSRLVLAASVADELNSAWAPEGNMFAYDFNNEIGLGDMPPPDSVQHVMETRAATIDRNPDWQPVTTAQVRPKGATPMHLPLTIAMKACDSANFSANHDPPISLGTCTPRPESRNLTVGDPLVNGKAANFTGYMDMKSIAGDAQMDISLEDVRCAAYLSLNHKSRHGTCAESKPFADYTFELGFQVSLRITDRSSAGAAGTLQDGVLTLPADYPLPDQPGPITCSATASTTVGSTCSMSTTLNAIVPGLIVAGKRASLEFLGARVLQSGNEPLLGSPFSDSAFAVPGTFYP